MKTDQEIEKIRERIASLRSTAKMLLIFLAFILTVLVFVNI